MAGALAEHEVLFPGHPVEGVLNASDQHVVVGGLEVFPREIRLDGDRAHVHQRAVELIDPVHQDGVFVNFLLFNFDETLSDRFDVTDPGITTLQRGEQAERGGGLAVILARGRDEHAWGSGVFQWHGRFLERGWI